MSRPRSFELSLSVGEDDVVVSGEYTAGSPARTWGPPEHCDPGDPSGVEITALVLEGDPTELCLLEALSDEELGRLCDTCCERLDEDGEDDPY